MAPSMITETTNAIVVGQPTDARYILYKELSPPWRVRSWLRNASVGLLEIANESKLLLLAVGCVTVMSTTFIPKEVDDCLDFCIPIGNGTITPRSIAVMTSTKGSKLSESRGIYQHF
jgi:hypothetical protein